MAFANTLLKKLLSVKNTVVTGCEFYTDEDVPYVRIVVSRSGFRESVFVEPDCLRVGNRAVKIDAQKAHEVQAVEDKVFRLLIAKVVQSLQNEDLNISMTS